ncbi:MAG: phosphoribosyltransferase [Candidatus Ranarchaeia archaeon]
MDYCILSWDEIYNMTLRLSERIVMSDFRPDIIVGIARGGWIPARILSDVLYTNALQNIRIEYYTDVGVKGREPIITQPLSGSLKDKSVLLVDEVADTGASLIHAINHVNEIGARLIKSAVLIIKSSSKIIPDYWMKRIDKWIVYPWEHRESIISLVKAFRAEKPGIEWGELRNKLVFEVGFAPAIVDYFMNRL